MKILYIASERSRAQIATRALRTVYPKVTVQWGSSYERAAFWILENPDLAALIVEVQSDNHGCLYLKQIHGLWLQAPVVMVLSEGAGSPIESLKAGADDYVVKGPSFSQELPAVVTRAIGRAQTPGVKRWDHQRSDTVAESAVGVPVDRRAHRDFSLASETRQPLDAPAVANRLAQRQGELDARLPDVVGNKSMLERRVSDLETSFHQREQRWAIEQSAAAGRQARLETLLHQEREIRTGLEQKLAGAQAALQDAERRHLSATTAAAAQLAERKTQYEIDMAQAATTQKMLAELLRQSRQRQASAVADVERLTRRDVELSSMLTEATATGNTLERRLADLKTALDAANERASRDQSGAAEQASERQAELQVQLEQEVEKRRNVEEDLARAKRAHDNSEKQRSSVVTAATALWAERQTQFDAELANAAEARNTLGRQARELEAALDQARQTLQAHATEVKRLTHREAALTSQLAEAAAIRSTLERQLTDAATALKDVDDGASRDGLAAETRAGERQVEFEGLIRHERATRADVEQRLAQVEAALREAEQQHASAMTAAATDRAERQAQFDAELTQAAEARNTLGREARELEAALDRARQTLQAHAATVERLTHREAELTSQLAEAATIRSTLERQLTEAATALRDADDDARRDRMAAETRAADREVEFEGLIRHERATRADVEQRLAQVEAALREAEQQHASAMTAAVTERAERQAQFEIELAQAAEARDALGREARELSAVLDQARQTLQADRLAAETRAADREVEFEGLIGHERATRADVEQRLAQVEAARREAEQQHASAMTAAATERAERQAQFEGLIHHERATRTDVEQRLAQEITRREALDRAVAEMRSAAANAEQRFREEIDSLTARARDEKTLLETQFAEAREDHNERQTELLNEIRNLEDARNALDESLASIREQSRRREIDYQNERDGLERARLTLETEVRRRAAELIEAQHNLEKAREDFQQTLDRVSGEHADSQAKLVAAVAERDARIEDVEKQLDESRLELRRQFQHAPLALWRCTRDGALTHANRALADLVGDRQPDELLGADFVKTVFESTDDLSWLIERCLSTKARQSVETTWKRKNGEHLVVRLTAMASAPDMIEIAVEDVTNVHVLEDKLAQAHRMESVGRLASEIAITCRSTLRDVHEDGQQWLTAVSDDTKLRKRGERLLGEVTRAASYLERLAAHGDEQTSALKPVELNRVLRDLKPVLKHVAGDDVDLELSKMSSPLNVDMKADHVERLLVNLASYGRERMPSGGRLRIELATVVVDQKFIADHPNVRRGRHALITVTAVRGDTPEPTPSEVASEKPGVDLGALQELIRECGGHLWLTVDPPRNMVVKIRLPLRVSDDRAHPTTSETPTSRERVMARLFHR